MKHGPWLKMWRCISWTWWFAIAMFTRHKLFFFLKSILLGQALLITWKSTKNELIFFCCFNNQTQHPKNRWFKPRWPVGIVSNLTIGLIIGRRWLKDSKPRRISSLATQRLFARGDCLPRFFFFSSEKQRFEGSPPKADFWDHDFFDWNPVIFDRGKFGGVFFRDDLPSSCSFTDH